MVRLRRPRSRRRGHSRAGNATAVVGATALGFRDFGNNRAEAVGKALYRIILMIELMSDVRRIVTAGHDRTVRICEAGARGSDDPPAIDFRGHVGSSVVVWESRQRRLRRRETSHSGSPNGTEAQSLYAYGAGLLLCAFSLEVKTRPRPASRCRPDWRAALNGKRHEDPPTIVYRQSAGSS